jgi:hypothetical protein
LRVPFDFAESEHRVGGGCIVCRVLLRFERRIGGSEDGRERLSVGAELKGLEPAVPLGVTCADGCRPHELKVPYELDVDA